MNGGFFARALAAAAKGVLWLLATLFIFWLFGLICYDGPLDSLSGNTILAGAWMLALYLVLKSSSAWAALPGLGLVSIVMLPWLAIKPSNDRDWKPEFARTGWSEIDGDQITLHEVRNFDYDRDGAAIERWESRVVHLSKLRGIDLFLDAFMGEWIAHPLVSFDFGEDGRVVLSIETRREKKESFSMLGGLYKRFELQYLFGDERDFVRVRTNLRHEPVYVYKLAGTAAIWREFFLESLNAQNELKSNPRFYNVVTANCTTSLRAQKHGQKRQRADIRLLLNGKLDEMLFERGALAVKDIPFAELRRRSLINDKALAAHDDPLFSERIRQGAPGYPP